MPPAHILNAPTKLMKDLGYGADYQYDHQAEEAFSGQNYFPDGMAREQFYRPRDRGFEREIASASSTGPSCAPSGGPRREAVRNFAARPATAQAAGMRRSAHSLLPSGSRR